MYLNDSFIKYERELGYMKFRCPECNSLKVFQFISVSAKRKMNGSQVVYGVNKEDLDNEFETYGCEVCDWSGAYEDMKPSK